MLRLLALVAITTVGCMRTTTFQCDPTGPNQCGTDGRCEAVGYCSFPDDDCDSGRAFGESSGPNSGQCTGGSMPGEAGMEPTTGNEAGMEMPSGCPGSYNTLPNSGTRGHRYRLITQTRVWTAQRDECSNMGTYLAFPDGPQAAMELAALRTLAGDGAWVGVEDQAVEGQYRNTLGALISAQTNALLATPQNGNGKDCFIINNTSIEHIECDPTPRQAVCECVP